MTRDYIAGAPVRVLASGPAGGVVGSAHTGKAKGCPDLLCVDMGGTSYDMSLVNRRRVSGGGRVEHAPPLSDRATDGEGGNTGRGWRVDLPCVGR